MAVLPQSREEMIQWFANRIASWAVSPTSIGLTAQQIVDLSTKLAQAQADLQAAVEIRIQSKNKTAAFHLSSDDLRDFGSDLIATVKARAEATNDPTIFQKASIPPPSPPSPVGPPATPTNLVAISNPFGYIDLAWKGARSNGVQFTIQRQSIELDGTLGTWTTIATVPANEYSDTTVPTGFRGMNYRVWAQRTGGQSQPTESTTVWFGVNGSSAFLKKANGDDLKLAS